MTKTSNTSWVTGTPRTGSMLTYNLIREIHNSKGFCVLPREIPQRDEEHINLYKKTSINDLNEKLCEIEETKRIGPKNPDPEQSVKMCKFDKSGFCRERENCQFSHGLKVCEEFLISSECTKQKCYERHPKRSIYFAQGECHWGLRCKHLHQAKKKLLRQMTKFLKIPNTTLKVLMIMRKV